MSVRGAGHNRSVNTLLIRTMQVFGLLAAAPLNSMRESCMTKHNTRRIIPSMNGLLPG